jgi:hypothetical protein
MARAADAVSGEFGPDNCLFGTLNIAFDRR